MPSANTDFINSSRSDELNLKHNTATSQLKQALAGATAGCVTRTLTQPFDVLKIRFQLQVEPVRADVNSKSKSKYTSIRQAVHLIYHEEGVRAFWKGHMAGQYMSILYSTLQFWSYEQINLSMSQVMKNQTHIKSFVSGALAGCLATCVTIPFDVVRTRLVAQDRGMGYKGVMSAFPIILREEGAAGLFRGFGPTLLQIGPMVGANFMFYETFNEFAISQLKPEDGRLPPWCHFITGCAAGSGSKFVTYPLDFIKKRLQLSGFESRRRTFGRTQVCDSMRSCIRITMKEEGFLGFYKGIVPTLLKSGLTSALYFSIYDACKEMLH